MEERFRKIKNLDEEVQGISADEIKDICRIEYMPNSNWTMGFNRRIMICDIDKEKNTIKRSVYIGEPLVPAYSKMERISAKERNKNQEDKIKTGKLVFVNNFTASNIIRLIEELHPETWPMRKKGDTIDGLNLDFAFILKNDNDAYTSYRYKFMENSVDEDCRRVFRELFRTVEISECEIVTVDEEMCQKDSRHEPGDYKL